MLNREHIRSLLARYIEIPGAKLLHKMGLTPNWITVIGFSICGVSALLVARGELFYGGLLFLVGAGLDLFDGGLARLTKTESPFGALLDSVLDRLGEASLLLGIAAYMLLSDFSKEKTFIYVMALILTLILSQSVSYLRARGEGLNAYTRTGLMTRPERVMILGFGLIIDHLVNVDFILWVLLVVSIISFFTLFQRIFAIRNILRKDD
ncbi:MAG: hypothetical protein CL886_03445 [Dehalococcoidia bacterium]|nr:hypothetical protein [Dehalococcoidia bacterium]|tara:strand:- start:271 stop:894 length:624 start_codon:yes stop_codon:yes gene_type:complete